MSNSDPDRLVPRRRKLPTAIASCLMLVASGVHSATITVTNENDSGAGSLRAAVAAANATVERDQIEFDTSVSRITLSGGQIEITESLIILGRVDDRVVIDANGSSRAFAVISAGAPLYLEGLEILNGSTTAAGEFPRECSQISGEGGAICSLSDLNIFNSAVRDSTTAGDSAGGGAIFAYNNLNLTNVSISGNSTQGLFAFGGALSVGTTTTNGNLLGQAVTISENWTEGDYSAGGAFFSRGDVTLARSDVSRNYTLGSNADGGAFFANGVVRLENSIISSNSVRGDNAEGGGFLSNEEIAIEYSTIANNATEGSGYSRGGGIYSQGLVTITNSTISGNSTVSPLGRGGGIFHSRDLLDIRYSTITGNTSNAPGAGIYHNSQSWAVVAREVILSNNSGPEGNIATRRMFLNVDWSVFGDDEPELLGPIGTVFTDEPLLAPLGDNGCWIKAGAFDSARCVPTHLPLTGSPALDIGTASPTFEYDQRGQGFPRVINGNSDAGAIESGPLPDLAVFSASVSETTLSIDQDFRVDATVLNGGDADSDPTTFRIKRSSDSIVDASDHDLASRALPALAPGDSLREGAIVSIAEPGTFWVGACADLIPGEIFNNNNCSDGIQVTVDNPNSPDLVVSSVAFGDLNRAPGENFVIRARAENQGTGTADATTLNYRLSPDPSIDAADLLLNSDNVWPLDASQEAAFGAWAVVNQIGSFWIGACVDPVPFEDNSANNCSSGTPISLTSNLFDDGFEVAILADGGLNDTGIDWCADDSSINLDCPVTGFEGQDGDFGRDAKGRSGELDKIGAGAAGFDFTKIDQNGNLLPESATEWSCVRDNHTGLIWEVKTTDGGLRDKSHAYSWYNPDSTSNGGAVGVINGGTCAIASCDTYGFSVAVNEASLCGAKDWRVPTINELFSIVNYGQGSFILIDDSYFPNSSNCCYWSSTPVAGNSDMAWDMRPNSGQDIASGKGGTREIRLVRREQ